MANKNKPLDYDTITSGPTAVAIAKALGWDVRRPDLRPYILDQAGDVMAEDSCFYPLFRIAVEAMTRVGGDARKEIFENVEQDAPYVVE